MANELKITDIVAKSATDQLETLRSSLEETKDTYATVAKELAKGIKIPVSSLGDLTQKAENYQSLTKKMAELESKLIQVQKERDTLLRQVTQRIKEATKETVNAAKAADLEAAADLKRAKAKTEEAKQQKLLNNERKQAVLSVEEAIKLSNREVRSINEANEVNKKLRATVKALTDEEDKDGKIRQRLNSAINVNTLYIRRNSDAMTQQKMTIGDYREQIKLAIMELRRGNNSMQNFGIVARGFGGILRESVSGGLRTVGTSVGSMIKGFTGAQLVMRGIDALTNAVRSGVKAMIDFEAANSKLAAILGTTSDGISNLERDARRLGATTKYTASEATNLQIELAKLGFTQKEILDSTEYVLKFAQATGAELPEAAALSGAALRMFNADTRETERYVSAMAVATTKSALSFGYLQTALPIVGPVAKSFNFTIEDTLALLGKLADSGFDASMAATATRNIFLNLADSSGKLAKEFGRPITNINELAQSLIELKNKGVDLNTTLELTDKRSVAAFNAFITSAEKIEPLREQITGVEKELGDMASTMSNNVQGAMAGLESAWEAFMLSFSGSTGPIKSVIDTLANGIRSVANSLKDSSARQLDYNDEASRAAIQRAKDTGELNKYFKGLSEMYKAFREQGMEEDEAAAEAQRIYIGNLKRRLESEQASYEGAVKIREKFDKELADREGIGGLGETLISWRRTINKIEDDIESASRSAAEGMAKVSLTEFIISELEAVNLTGKKVEQATTRLTEKQKKELEKQQKERQKILNEYQQSEIDIMDEGLDKELKSIELSYTKRIAAITGNSEKEQKARENLAKAMEDALAKKRAEHAINQEKANLNNQLGYVMKWSNDELQIRFKLLDLQEKEEIIAAEKNGANINDIEKKYQKEKQRVLQEYADENIKIIGNKYAMRAVTATKGLQDELEKLSKLYADGLIDAEEYEEKRTKLANDYAIDSAQLGIEMIKEQLDTENLSAEKRLELNQALADAEMALKDAVIASNEEQARAREEALAKAREGFEALREIADESVDGMGDLMDGLYSIFEAIEKGGKDTFAGVLAGAIQMVSGIKDMVSGMYDSKIEELEKEEEANEEAKEKELERIEELAEHGAISEEEAEARKRAAEDKTAAKNAEVEKKKAELQTRQAKFEKAMNITQTIMATSLAVVKALPNTVLAALVAAMGAAQLAMIIAQPIPKYAKGTKDHKGGLAWVGDGGKHEGVITEKGLWVTPDTPTLIDLPKHAMVVPDIQKYLTAKGLQSDLLNKSKGQNDPVIVNVNNDYTKLEREMMGNRGELRKLTKVVKKMSRTSELRGLYGRI